MGIVHSQYTGFRSKILKVMFSQDFYWLITLKYARILMGFCEIYFLLNGILVQVLWGAHAKNWRDICEGQKKIRSRQREPLVSEAYLTLGKGNEKKENWVARPQIRRSSKKVSTRPMRSSWANTAHWKSAMLELGFTTSTVLGHCLRAVQEEHGPALTMY